MHNLLKSLILHINVYKLPTNTIGSASIRDLIVQHAVRTLVHYDIEFISFN